MNVMTMNSGELEKLAVELTELPNETEWVEFKVDNINPLQIGRAISALSNGAALHEKEWAYIVFGVEDATHKIAGTIFRPRLAKKGNEELESWLVRKLDPSIHFQVFEFPYQGNHLVIFEIPPAIDRPIRFDNEAYIRIGSYTEPLKDYPEKEKRIWNNPRHRTFEHEAACSKVIPNKVLTLLDFPSYFELTKQPLPNSRDAILEKLEQDGLIVTERGGLYIITNLGAILFAKDLREFDSLRRNAVRVIEYAGEDRTQPVREQEGHKGYASGFSGLIESTATARGGGMAASLEGIVEVVND